MIAKLLRFALHQRFVTIGARPRADRPGRLGLPAAQDRGLSRHLRHPGGGDHALSRARRRRGGTAGHGPHRARAEQRAQRDRAPLAHHLRPLGGGADLRLRHRRLLRAPGGARKTARRDAARRRHARRWARSPRPSANCTATCRGRGLQRLMELREVEDWVIEPRFLQVPGVADVTPFGGLVKQYQVEIDPHGARPSTTSPSARSPRRWAPTTRTPAARCSTTSSSRW